MRAGALPFGALPAWALPENAYPAWGDYVTILVIEPAILSISFVKGALVISCARGVLVISNS